MKAFQPDEFEVRFKGIPLPAERVPPHHHVDSAEGLLRVAIPAGGGVRDVIGQHDHAGTRPVDREPAGDRVAQRLSEAEDSGEFIHHGRFATGNDQPVNTLEVCRPAHGNGPSAAGVDRSGMFAEIALKRQNANHCGPANGDGVEAHRRACRRRSSHQTIIGAVEPPSAYGWRSQSPQS